MLARKAINIRPAHNNERGVDGSTEASKILQFTAAVCGANATATSLVYAHDPSSIEDRPTTAGSLNFQPRAGSPQFTAAAAVTNELARLDETSRRGE